MTPEGATELNAEGACSTTDGFAFSGGLAYQATDTDMFYVFDALEVTVPGWGSFRGQGSNYRTRAGNSWHYHVESNLEYGGEAPFTWETGRYRFQSSFTSDSDAVGQFSGRVSVDTATRVGDFCMVHEWYPDETCPEARVGSLLMQGAERATAVFEANEACGVCATIQIGDRAPEEICE